MNRLPPKPVTRPADEADAAVDSDAFSLARWSARKRAAARPPAPPADAAADAEQAAADAERAAAADGRARDELTDADMPPLDSIDERSDVSAFFAPKVSAELRRLALRKLFRLPGYNIRDGLNDYDDDYTAFAPLGDIVTADMRHRANVKKQRLAGTADNADAADGETGSRRAAPAEPGADPQRADTATADQRDVADASATPYDDDARDTGGAGGSAARDGDGSGGDGPADGRSADGRGDDHAGPAT